MKTTVVAIIALVLSIIAFTGMIGAAIEVDDLQGSVFELAFKENYVPITSFDDDVLDRALLTEEQREAGLYLVRLNDGRVQLRCRNGEWIATFDVDASVSDVRYAADIEMMWYWAGTSECLKDVEE